MYRAPFYCATIYCAASQASCYYRCPICLRGDIVVHATAVITIGIVLRFREKLRCLNRQMLQLCCWLLACGLIGCADDAALPIGMHDYAEAHWLLHAGRQDHVYCRCVGLRRVRCGVLSTRGFWQEHELVDAQGFSGASSGRSRWSAFVCRCSDLGCETAGAIGMSMLAIR